MQDRGLFSKSREAPAPSIAGFQVIVLNQKDSDSLEGRAAVTKVQSAKNEEPKHYNLMARHSPARGNNNQKKQLRRRFLDKIAASCVYATPTLSLQVDDDYQIASRIVKLQTKRQQLYCLT
eukprot:TsM_001125900 transcript=TsM_001125900 gene=TsM_001125900